MVTRTTASGLWSEECGTCEGVLLLGQLGRCYAYDSGSTSHSGSFDGATLGRGIMVAKHESLLSGSDTVGGECKLCSAPMIRSGRWIAA